MNQRKGPRRRSNVDPQVLAQLHLGTLETVNLMEGLAIDPQLLLSNVLKHHERFVYFEPIVTTLSHLKKPTLISVHRTIGEQLWLLTSEQGDASFLHLLAQHPSDTVRGWACFAMTADDGLNLAEAFMCVQPFAADGHFAVREWSWLSVRPRIIRELESSIMLLSTWTGSQDENIRRFCSEATRPRGVWCAHITKLKANPELGLAILEPLKADPSRYVQNSVGNWLNDASKDRPEVVRAICQQWLDASQAQATRYIVRRALRSLKATKP